MHGNHTNTDCTDSNSTRHGHDYVHTARLHMRGHRTHNSTQSYTLYMLQSLHRCRHHALKSTSHQHNMCTAAGDLLTAWYLTTRQTMLLENVHTRGAPGINLLQTQESIVHCYTAPMITNAASDHSQHYVLLVSCYAMHKLSVHAPPGRPCCCVNT